MNAPKQPLDSREELLRDFAVKNHAWVQAYHRAVLRHMLLAVEVPISTRIEWLMLNTLNEAGGNPPINHKADTIRKVRVWTDKMQQSGGRTFQAFCRAAGVKGDKPGPLVAGLRNKLTSLKQVKDKKANLFLRDLIIHLGPTIFDSFDPDEFTPYLHVPVDTVHKQVFALFKGLDSTKAITQADIADWSRRLSPENPIRMDDLWFWGHFSLVKKTSEKDLADKNSVEVSKYSTLTRGSPNSEMIETDHTLCLLLLNIRETAVLLARQFIAVVLGVGRDSARTLMTRNTKKVKRAAAGRKTKIDEVRSSVNAPKPAPHLQSPEPIT